MNLSMDIHPIWNATSFLVDLTSRVQRYDTSMYRGDTERGVYPPSLWRITHEGVWTRRDGVNPGEVVVMVSYHVGHACGSKYETLARLWHNTGLSTRHWAGVGITLSRDQIQILQMCPPRVSSAPLTQQPLLVVTLCALWSLSWFKKRIIDSFACNYMVKFDLKFHFSPQNIIC